MHFGTGIGGGKPVWKKCACTHGEWGQWPAMWVGGWEGQTEQHGSCVTQPPGDA